MCFGAFWLRIQSRTFIDSQVRSGQVCMSHFWWRDRWPISCDRSVTSVNFSRASLSYIIRFSYFITHSLEGSNSYNFYVFKSTSSSLFPTSALTILSRCLVVSMHCSLCRFNYFYWIIAWFERVKFFLYFQLLWLPREIGACDFILWTQMHRLQNVRGHYIYDRFCFFSSKF